MKIAIIGSTQYSEKFLFYDLQLKEQGHEVKVPAFDHFKDFTELAICEYNRDIIEWADEVHMIWDGRSTGTIFDFGMVFMARKPFKIVYFEPKSFKNLMEQYEAQSARV